MRKKINVLLVDDSVFIRRLLESILESSPELQVIGMATNGQEGFEKIKALKPDVVIMDVQMPVMDGITCLEKVMKFHPTPVIILSSITKEGSQAAMKAYALGAFDVVVKPFAQKNFDVKFFGEEIIERVKVAARANISKSRFHYETLHKKSAPLTLSLPQNAIEIVVIGISTGGPAALQNVLPKIPSGFPVPVLVVQHMPLGFTKYLAKTLNGICKEPVIEVSDGEELSAGFIYIAPSGLQTEILKSGKKMTAHVVESTNFATLYKPSLDVTLVSLSRHTGAGTMAVVMTGMGSDGLEGVKTIKSLGGFAIAESEETCLVYGMPKAIIEAGLADRIESLDNIGRAIIECVGGNKRYGNI